MKKKYIIGAVFAVFMMLVIPNISAVSINAIEDTNVDETESCLRNSEFYNSKTLYGDFPNGGRGGIVTIIGMILAAIYSVILYRIIN